ncbi:DUF1810 domain-containing protein [Pedobacter aquatilis]|uniref:DUF1810 domain-containing protein n=1 Tax=Pedobacter aquatilis TaxID=351343 RepID=UPI00292E19FE|nr:DUF1810 domain-containing protein [Pedobacter aquatilis]
MELEKLERFLTAQNESYLRAIAEVSAGYKRTHWMWYIFPQLQGLGKSETAQYFGLSGLDEAAGYLRHPILGANLREITSALLSIQDRSAQEIFGSPDEMKLHSCMTLFARIPGADEIFRDVLIKYYGGQEDELTLTILNEGTSGR